MLEIVLHFGAILSASDINNAICGGYYISWRIGGVVTNHGVTASAGVTRTCFTFAPSRKIKSYLKIATECIQFEKDTKEL